MKLVGAVASDVSSGGTPFAWGVVSSSAGREEEMVMVESVSYGGLRR